MNTLAIEFVPESISSIWDKPAVVTLEKLQSGAEFQTFLEPTPLSPIADDSNSSLNELPISIADYSKYLNMIYSEHAAVRDAFKRFTLFNVKPRYKKHKNVLEFIVPGLADSQPMINEGDWMILRAYIPIKNSTAVYTYSEEFHTRISVLIRKDNRIFAPVDLPANYGLGMNEALWSVRFIPSGVPYLLTSFSVAFIHSHPELFDSILFPKNYYKNRKSPFKWDNDPMLNDCQNAFIKTVIGRTSLAFKKYESKSELDLPVLLVGPFGTGKTRTFVKTLQQIVCQFERGRILAIAPSQSAADTIALNLLSIGMDAKKIFRFNSPLRDIYSLPFELAKVSHVNLTSFALPESLLEYSIVVCTTIEAQLLVNSKFTNLDIAEMRKEGIQKVNEQLKHCGLPKYKYDKYHFHWTHLAVDEAAQATEPSLSPALHLVASKHFNIQIILSGDPQQLGPNVISDQALSSGLALSLMERLTLQSYYRQAKAPLFNLCENYRSHQELLMMPSALFYSQDLIPYKLHCEENHFDCFSRVPSYSYAGVSQLKEFPKIESKIPFLFHPVRGTENHGHLENILTAGWYNPEEASVILTLVQTLIKSFVENIKNDIGIMTVSRRQVAYLRNIFRKADLSDINIGTVEDYQVRVSEELVDQDIKQNLGLVNQHKRLNVAISRAKNLLIIVGSPKHLWRDDLWKQLILFCDRNGLWLKKADKEDEMQPLDIENWVVKRNRFSNSEIGSQPKLRSHDLLVSSLEQFFRAQAHS